WFGPAPAIAEADLRPVGTDQLAGTVTNRLTRPLYDALLVFRRHVYQLGTVAPGATVRAELSPDRQLAGLLRTQSGNYLPGQDYVAQGGRISRPDLLWRILFPDSQGTSAVDRPLASAPLRHLDLSGQLALDRPMLVARVDRPAARLVLENAPSPPKVDQTTMVRVILPLSR